MENTLPQFEVEIMFSSKGEDIMNGSCMTTDGGSSGNGYIIHVNTNEGAKEFVLSYDGVKDMIHHSLECHRQVSEAKEHDSWIKESVLCFESCFVFVAFLYMYIVVSPLNVQLCINVCSLKVHK